jgi:hypothetical protein
MAYWYDFCPGREKAPAPEPMVAVVGLVAQHAVLYWASRVQPLPRLLRASHHERDGTLFLLKREASVKVRA